MIPYPPAPSGGGTAAPPAVADMAPAEALPYVLARRVPFLSLPLIAATWWTDDSAGEQAARRLLRRLEAAGRLARHRVLAQPALALTAPLTSWRPGEPAPDFGPLAYRCRARWTTPVATTVWAAAARATGRKGGGFPPGPRRPAQARHDLAVAQIYCLFLRSAPERARDWMPEAFLVAEEPGDRLPDALLMGADKKPYLAIEFGGACLPARIAKLHRFCQKRGLPWELW